MSTTIPSRTTHPQRGSVRPGVTSARVVGHQLVLTCVRAGRRGAHGRRPSRGPAPRTPPAVACTRGPRAAGAAAADGPRATRAAHARRRPDVGPDGRLGLALARGARAADGPAPAIVVQTHVVLPGETLWGIAQQVAPHDDRRDTVARIAEFNSLTSTAVHAENAWRCPRACRSAEVRMRTGPRPPASRPRGPLRSSRHTNGPCPPRYVPLLERTATAVRRRVRTRPPRPGRPDPRRVAASPLVAALFAEGAGATRRRGLRPWVPRPTVTPHLVVTQL